MLHCAPAAYKPFWFWDSKKAKKNSNKGQNFHVLERLKTYHNKLSPVPEGFE
jgi:hypothetical protein